MVLSLVTPSYLGVVKQSSLVTDYDDGFLYLHFLLGLYVAFGMRTENIHTHVMVLVQYKCNNKIFFT